MSQAPLTVPNDNGYEVRTDINAALQAVATGFSGPTQPSETYAYMGWLDTSTTPPTPKRRNSSNTGWEIIAVTTNTVSELTAGAGVTVDGLLIKDGGIGLVDGLGADAVGFKQTGSGAVVQRVLGKLRRVGGIELEDFGSVDTTGVAEATAVFNLAAAEAAAKGVALLLPAGTILLDAVTLPTTLPALIGRNKRGTALKFKRQAYSAGQVLLNAASNTAGIELSRFTIDCDSAEFKTAGVYALVLNGSNYAQVDKVRVLGRGEAGLLALGMVGGRIHDVTIDCAGTAGSTMRVGFYGANCNDVVITGMRTTGYPEYSGVFGEGSAFAKFVECHTEGTSGGFGYSLGGCAYSHIQGCTAKNTSHEAYQITNSYFCSIDGNTAEWETGYGVDAGISVNGEAGVGGLTRLNRVVNNIIANSYAAGLLCANNAQLNTFSNNTLRDCGVRGTAAGATGTSTTPMGQYTDLVGVACSGNTFSYNKVATESGNVVYGYAEFNLGAEAVLAGTNVLDTEFMGGGGFTTARYLFVDSTTSRAFDLDWQSFVPAIFAAAGTLGGVTTNSAKFRRRGGSVEMTIDITIASAGTGTSSLVVLWPTAPNAGVNAGSFFGIENGVTNKAVAGAANAGGVVLLLADGTTVIATGARIVLSGSYRVA